MFNFRKLSIAGCPKLRRFLPKTYILDDLIESELYVDQAEHVPFFRLLWDPSARFGPHFIRQPSRSLLKIHLDCAESFINFPRGKNHGFFRLDAALGAEISPTDKANLSA
jgi:hypothetical protein